MTQAQLVQPISILIAALGGEGGGVLSGWLTSAANEEGYPVQSTSIPGVAQRTGATTYYVEIFPRAWSDLGDISPLMALSPTPGNLDVMVATEFLEAARAIENGWVTPERTVLIASNHRAYSILERSAMGDGRYDSDRIHHAVRQRSRTAVVFDMDQAAREAGSMLSPVVLGAIARTAGLPIRRETFEAVIKASGIAVDTNLQGFSAGFEKAAGDARPPAIASPLEQSLPHRDLLVMRVNDEFSDPVAAVALEGVRRLVNYQNPTYAALYLDRLRTVAALDQKSRGWKLTAEVARMLALRMSYEDIIRVADLKTRSERSDRVRSEVKARPDEPVVTTEFLKPGLDELTALLPPFIGRRIMAFAEKRGWQDKLNVGLYLKTNTILGFFLLWSMGRLRQLRRWTWRYAEEQSNIENWLEATRQAAQIDYDFGLEVCECARLVKGYGSTHRRGIANFDRIFNEAVWPAIRKVVSSAAVIAKLREAALADPEGKSLDRAFEAAGQQSPG